MKGDEGSFQDSKHIYQYACFTDIGCVRERNEDDFLVLVDHKVFAIADGVGGLSDGEMASKIALEGVQTSLDNPPPRGLLNFLPKTDRGLKEKLKRAVDKANKNVYQTTIEKKEKSATTLVVAGISDGRVVIAHVGDSRAYLFRENSLSLLTADHTVAQELASRDAVKSGSVNTSQYNNIITRAIGAKHRVEADYQALAIRRHDYVLLCSDGLTAMVSDSSLREILQQKKSIKDLGEQFIAAAKHAGGRDNITVVLIHRIT